MTVAKLRDAAQRSQAEAEEDEGSEEEQRSLQQVLPVLQLQRSAGPQVSAVVFTSSFFYEVSI